MLNSFLALFLFLIISNDISLSKEIDYFVKSSLFENNSINLIEIVQDRSYYGINKDILKKKFITAVVESIKDDYSGIEFSEKNSFKNYINNNYSGFGFDMDLIDFNGSKELVVSNVLTNGNAKDAGLTVGDIIKKINGIPVKGNSNLYNAALSLVESGKDNEFIIMRDGTEKKLYIRETHYIEPSIESKTIDKNIYYIDINSFSEDMYEDFKNEIFVIDKFRFEKIIIDLRHNPGGSIQSAVDCLSLLTEERPIAYIKNKKGFIPLMPNVKNENFIPNKNLEFVLLVSSDTASSAELFASVLKKNKNSVIVGQKTYGKTSVQEIFNYGDAEIKLTTGFFSVFNDIDPNKSSITPDYIIEEIYPIPYHDKSLEKALFLLKN